MEETPADRLKRARIERGFRTAKQFSDTHGIPQPTYSMAEKGSRGITSEAAVRYAELLRINVHWLLTGEGDMERSGDDGESALGAEERAFMADMEYLAEVAPEDYEDIRDLLRKRAERARARQQQSS